MPYEVRLTTVSAEQRQSALAVPSKLHFRASTEKGVWMSGQTEEQAMSACRSHGTEVRWSRDESRPVRLNIRAFSPQTKRESEEILSFSCKYLG